ncbi:MAG: MFS transporter [Chloroflexota bacterium]|nr:MFS transporter [Chloroflexota bacterium]
MGIILVLYNLYLGALGYRADFVGAILFVGTIGAGLAIFPAGVCVDRFGGKAVQIWASLLLGVIAAGQILFRQPTLLLLSGFGVGVVGAALLVVNAPYLTANSTPAERSHLFSLNLVVYLITSVLGRVLGGALPIWFRDTPWLMAPLPPWLNWILVPQPGPRSYQFALLFAGIIAMPSIVPLFFMSDDRPARIPGQAPQQMSGMTREIVARIREWRRRISRSSVLAMSRSAVFLFTLVWALIGLGAGLFIPYFNLYFVQHLGAPSWLFGLIDGAATGLTALSTLAAPWLAARLGKIKAIALAQLASIPLLVALGPASILPLVALLYLLRQSLMDMPMGLLQVFSMEVVPGERRGLANSSYQAVYQVAWAISAPIGGLIIVQLGYPLVFLLAAVCYLLAVGTLWRGFGGAVEAQPDSIVGKQAVIKNKRRIEG